MQTVGNTEITAVIHLYDKSQFLSAGWNRKIVSFSDESEVIMCLIVQFQLWTEI